jgi:hypothetical protein
LLREFPQASRSSELGRRWFSDDYFDLIVWLRPDLTVSGFQLCYDIAGQERALTWTDGQGFCHHRVDGGEAVPTKNLTPILIPDGVFPAAAVMDLFIARSQGIDEGVRFFVVSKLNSQAETDRKAQPAPPPDAFGTR